MLNANMLKFSSFLAAGALSVACSSAQSGNPANPGAGSSPGGETPTSNGGAINGGAANGGAQVIAGATSVAKDPPQPGKISQESAGILPLRRLTHREYSNTMAELLGDTTKPGSKFEPDGPGAGGFEAPNTVATETARGYLDSAETLATRTRWST